MLTRDVPVTHTDDRPDYTVAAATAELIWEGSQ